MNFKEKLKNNFIKELEEEKEEIKFKEKKFKLERKNVKKILKKSFPLNLENEKVKNLDKICKKTGYSRNELITKMIEFCLENLDLV